jgi:hypothetical protein
MRMPDYHKDEAIAAVDLLASLQWLYKDAIQ